MAISPISAISPAQPGQVGQVTPAPAAGFGDALMRGLEGVSGLERQADAVTQSLATGGSAQIHDLMTATAKASLGVDLLVQVRNRAVEAYQEIMRLQV